MLKSFNCALLAGLASAAGLDNGNGYENRVEYVFADIGNKNKKLTLATYNTENPHTGDVEINLEFNIAHVNQSLFKELGFCMVKEPLAS